MLDPDEKEIERVILSLKNNCAPGWDNISCNILKTFKHILVPPLTHIFRICLSIGVFPLCLKKAIVIPIHKSGTKDLVTNYRPISLLPTFSKVLEKIINNKLVSFLEQNSLFSPMQFGFRPKLSTADAVHNLTAFISEELGKGKQVIGIFLDLAKAFDTVSVPILLKKLDALGIRGTQHKLLTDYLQNRYQCVKIDNIISADLQVPQFGIPQGSVLGSTLFLVYINDLCNLSLPSGKIVSYADDTALLFSADTNEAVLKNAQRGFDVVNKWLINNLLTLNTDKTKFIKFNMRNQQDHLSNIRLYAHHCNNTINDDCTCSAIHSTANIKYLGVIIDHTLSFKQHIAALSSRLRKLIFVFKKLRYIADNNLIIQIYKALCQSIIQYCITSWGGIAKSVILTIERAQRALLKVATHRPFRYPTCLLYQNCKILTVRQLFIMHTVLKQHTTLDYNPELTNTKRRKDIVCTTQSQSKYIFTNRFFAFLGPFLYNNVNKITAIYDKNYANTKQLVQQYLQTLNYDQTENMMTVVQ